METNKVDKNIEHSESIYKPLTYEIQEPCLLQDSRKSKKTNFFLYFSSLTADLLMFDCGCNFTWTSPAILTLRSLNPDINPLGSPVTPIQESFLASLIHLGAAIGPLLFGKFADIFGRKKLMIMIAVLKILSYVMLAFAENIYLYLLSRFLIGIGVGLSFAVMPMYTGEISEDHNRGKLVTIMGVVMTLGTLYPLIIGPILPIKLFSLSCTLSLIIALIGFMWIPETPVFYISKGNTSDAKKALMKLKNLDSESAEKYLAQLLDSHDSNASKSSFIEIFKKPALRKGVIICLSLCSLQHLSGFGPIIAFIQPIFEITGSGISADVSIILISIVQLVSTILSSFSIDKLGRKPLLLLSTIGTSLSLLSIGIYFYLKHIQFLYIHTIFWLPIASLMLYMISFSTGLGCVPMAILSEIFPSNVRSTATSLVTCFGACTGFMVTFIFPIMMVLLTEASSFLLFSGFTALGTIFIYVVVPETKGKSISEIQNILGGTRK